jgi:gag-polyprotein putative aspartyl protease
MYNYQRLKRNNLPAPVIDLTAFVPGDNSLASTAKAIVDTGASVTCVPVSVIDDLGRGNLVSLNPVGVKGALNNRRSTSYRETYIIDIMLGNCYFEKIKVVVLHGMDYALIGRDILNNYKITFDAPNDSWKVAADCT